MRWNSGWKTFVAGVLTTLVILLLLGGILVATNYGHLNRALKVISLVSTQALEPAPAVKMVDGALAGIVESLDDPYASYLPPQEYHDLAVHIAGEYGGVGLLITRDEEERIVVVSPFKGTPAFRAGIKAGDFIVEIDGQSTAGWKLDRAAQVMQGEPGTEVILGIFRTGEQKLRTFPLQREKIRVPSVEGQLLDKDRRLAYFSLSNFNERTAMDLGVLLQEMRQQGMKAAILDLRNNPGGSLGAAVDVASFFVPPGPVVYLVDRQQTVAYEARDNYLQMPLVVLVNKGSASASEIVAGAIKDRETGVIIGEKTFGKGLVQTVFELDGGAAVKLTTAKYLTPGKHDINRKGIEPDLEVKLDPTTEAEVWRNAPDWQRDTQLQKAVQVLQARIGGK